MGSTYDFFTVITNSICEIGQWTFPYHMLLIRFSLKRVVVRHLDLTLSRRAGTTYIWNCRYLSTSSLPLSNRSTKGQTKLYFLKCDRVSTTSKLYVFFRENRYFSNSIRDLMADTIVLMCILISIFSHL